MGKNISIGDSMKLKLKYDYLAPDKSEIRNLLNLTHGGLAHCTLPPNSKSNAVKHQTVEEIWYFLEGFGEFWRSNEDDNGEETPIEPGMCISIPPRVHFQFRSIGEKALKAIIVTMPIWPGKQEAIEVKNHW